MKILAIICIIVILALILFTGLCIYVIFSVSKEEKKREPLDYDIDKNYINSFPVDKNVLMS